MIGATDVFVSYKAEDRARLRPLIAALEEEGFTVWWDTHIGGGAHWREDIQEHLDAAKCVIVVWSKRSLGQKAISFATRPAVRENGGAYLPVRLDPVDRHSVSARSRPSRLRGGKEIESDPRFLALADAVRRRIAGEDIAHVDLDHAGRAFSRRALVGGSAGVAAILAAGGALDLPQVDTLPMPSGSPSSRSTTSLAIQIRRISPKASPKNSARHLPASECR